MLFLVDMIGVVIIFNVSHFLVRDIMAADLLLNWKLLLICSITFLYYYLMDLYVFESSLTQLGHLERSFIAMSFIGLTTAIAVYAIGPSFIGGFVGRGVLATSLIALWLWSLSIRYLINAWLRSSRSQVKWLVLINQANITEFVSHFRSRHKDETLLLLVEALADDLTLDELTQVVGNWDELDTLIRREAVAGVIVVSKERLPRQLLEQLMQIRIHGIRVYDLNDFYERFLARLPLFNLDENWIAMSHGFDLLHNPFGLRFKRYLDLLFAIVLGIVLAPLLLVLVVLVFVASGLPIFYNQTRTGENGRNFVAHKFRTMVQDAETQGAQFAQVRDPRITAIGKLLRKFRLDELPQLWNVLKGDMSFIGPRPERPEFIEDLERRIPYYSLRHLVKPGITGWAQVMYGYGDSVDDAIEKLQYDLFYVKNYSLLLDMSIMIRSMKVVLFGTGR